MAQLFEKIFDVNKYPELQYRTCDGILNRYRKLKTSTQRQAFDQACLLAIELGVYNYFFIDNYLKNNMHKFEHNDMVSKPLPKHDNIRGRESFK